MHGEKFEILTLLCISTVTKKISGLHTNRSVCGVCRHSVLMLWEDSVASQHCILVILRHKSKRCCCS